MPFKDYREESKIGWGKECLSEKNLNREELEFGCLLRIADAMEIMAKNNANLIEERDRYEKWYQEARDRNEQLHHSISGLRGHITRLKKK